MPSIAATATTPGSAAATNKVCNLPANIAAGNLLLLQLRSADAETHSTPTGWTQLFLNDSSDGATDVHSLWYREADGNEGASVTVNGTVSLKFSSLSWRITGHESPAVQVPEFSTLAVGSSTTPDPPSFTPAGGPKDFLLIWMGCWEGEQTSPPASNPTNYGSNIIGASSGVGGAIATNCRSASASREANITTEDAGSWTISVLDDWTAWLVVVHPETTQRHETRRVRRAAGVAPPAPEPRAVAVGLLGEPVAAPSEHILTRFRRKRRGPWFA